MSFEELPEALGGLNSADSSSPTVNGHVRTVREAVSESLKSKSQEAQEQVVSEARARYQHIHGMLGLPEGAYSGPELKYLMAIDPEGTLASMRLEHYEDDPEPTVKPSNGSTSFYKKQILTADEKREGALFWLTSPISGRAQAQPNATRDIPECRTVVQSLKGHDWLHQKELQGRLQIDPAAAMQELKSTYDARPLSQSELYTLARACRRNSTVLDQLRISIPALFTQMMQYMSGSVRNIPTSYESPRELWEQYDRLDGDKYLSCNRFESACGPPYNNDEEILSYLEYYKQYPERLQNCDVTAIIGNLLLWIKRFEPEEMPLLAKQFIGSLLRNKSQIISDMDRWHPYIDFQSDGGNFLDVRTIINQYSLSSKDIEPLLDTMRDSGIEDPKTILREEPGLWLQPEFLRFATGWWSKAKNRPGVKLLKPEALATELIDYMNTYAPIRIRRRFVDKKYRSDSDIQIPTAPIHDSLLLFTWLLAHKNTYSFATTFQYSDILYSRGSRFEMNQTNVEIADTVLATHNPSCEELWEAIYTNKNYKTDPMFWLIEMAGGSRLYNKLFYQNTVRTGAFIQQELIDRWDDFKFKIYIVLRAIAVLARYDSDLAMDLVDQLDQKTNFVKNFNNGRDTDACRYLTEIAYAPVLHPKQRIQKLSDTDHLEEQSTLRVRGPDGTLLSPEAGKGTLHILGLLERFHHKKTGVSAIKHRVPIQDPTLFAQQLVSLLATEGEAIFLAAARVRQQKRESRSLEMQLEDALREMRKQLDNPNQKDKSSAWSKRKPMLPIKSHPGESPATMARLEWLPTGPSAYLTTTLFDRFSNKYCAHLPADNPAHKTLLDAISRNRPKVNTKSMAIEVYDVSDGAKILIPHGATLVQNSLKSNLPKVSLHQNPDHTYSLQSGKLKDEVGSIEFTVDVPLEHPEPGEASVQDIHDAIQKAMDVTSDTKKPTFWQRLTRQTPNQNDEPLRSLTTPLTAEKELPKDLLRVVRVARKAKTAKETVAIIRAAVHKFGYDLSIIDDPRHTELLKGIPYNVEEGNRYLQLIYERRSGICGDLSSVFVDLLRHARVPVHEADGAVAKSTDISGNHLHAWGKPILLDTDDLLYLEVEEATNGGMNTVLSAIQQQFQQDIESEPPPSLLLEFDDEVEQKDIPPLPEPEQGNRKKTVLPTVEHKTETNHTWLQYWEELFAKTGLTQLMKKPEEAKQAYLLCRAIHSLIKKNPSLNVDGMAPLLPEMMETIEDQINHERKKRNSFNHYDAVDIFPYLHNPTVCRHLKLYLNSEHSQSLSAEQRKVLLAAIPYVGSGRWDRGERNIDYYGEDAEEGNASQ